MCRLMIFYAEQLNEVELLDEQFNMKKLEITMMQ